MRSSRATGRTVRRACGASAGIVAAAGIAVLISSRTASSSIVLDRVQYLPAAPASGLRVPAPTRLSTSTAVSYWASVREAAVARVRPDIGAAAIASLATTTPEATTNIVTVLGRARDTSGRLWVHVRLPVLPAGRTGWIPRSALGVYGAVRTHLVVDRARLTATLLRDGVKIFRAPVGVGRPESPTPAGEFYIRDFLTRYKSPFYGPVAFGTSARSSVLTDWPGGGFIGIHGTNEPNLLPGRVSHGCIRLSNSDILRLARLMPVGTPVTIR
jgi:lipoprotein-anchoring transpeptidase ErfK/SrfK